MAESPRFIGADCVLNHWKAAMWFAVRYALKEAGLQNSVLTNRNWIQRLYRSDEVALPVPSIGMILTYQGRLAIKCLCSRSSGYWVKKYVLIPMLGTGNGEILDSMRWRLRSQQRSW